MAKKKKKHGTTNPQNPHFLQDKKIYIFSTLEIRKLCITEHKQENEKNLKNKTKQKLTTYSIK